MSRKDYIKFAKLINDNIIVEEDNQLNSVITLHSDLINKLGRILKEDNNNFVFDKWNNACFKGFEDVINHQSKPIAYTNNL